MIKINKYLTIALLVIATINATSNINANYTGSFFVPRQLAYNPVLENALTFNQINDHTACKYCFSLKPIYTKTTGQTFDANFNVEENGSGDIDSLWFEVISSDSTYYSSKLTFKPASQKYGSMLYGELQLPKDFYLSLNTAIIGATNNLHAQETNINNLGTTNYQTILESLASSKRTYGKVNGKTTKAGLDDIQIKIGKNFYGNNQTNLDLYGLIGLPTNHGSKAIELFEPLVGSKHLQLGLGLNYYNCFYQSDTNKISFSSELKWRYGFSANETRLFDLSQNGLFSRYMLLVDSASKYNPFFASNYLALNVQVTPRNAFDLYLALNVKHLNWQFEAGYDLWFRNSEKIKLSKKTALANNLGIADLLGIINLDPQSASTSNISQGVISGINQMVSDPVFVEVTSTDLNLTAGAAPQAFSNTIYGSIGYNYASTLIGLNGSYEVGHNQSYPDIFSIWLTCNFSF